MLHPKLSFLGPDVFDIESQVSRGWAIKATDFAQPYWTIFNHAASPPHRAINLNSCETPIYRSFASFQHSSPKPRGIGAHESRYRHSSPSGRGMLCGAYWLLIVGRDGILGSKFLPTRQEPGGAHYPSPLETEFFALLQKRRDELGPPGEAHVFFFVERDTLRLGHLKDAAHQIAQLRALGFTAVAYAPLGRAYGDWGPEPENELYWPTYFCVRPEFCMRAEYRDKVVVDRFKWVLDFDGDVVVVGPRILES